MRQAAARWDYPSIQIFIRFAVCNNGVAALSTDADCRISVAASRTNTKLGVWLAQDLTPLTFQLPVDHRLQRRHRWTLSLQFARHNGHGNLQHCTGLCGRYCATADDPAYNASSAFKQSLWLLPPTLVDCHCIGYHAIRYDHLRHWELAEREITRATDTGTSR